VTGTQEFVHPHERRKYGAPPVVMVLGHVTAVVVLVLADMTPWLALGVIGSAAMTGVVAYRLLVCGPLPRYVRATNGVQARVPSGAVPLGGAPDGVVTYLPRTAEGAGDGAP